MRSGIRARTATLERGRGQVLTPRARVLECALPSGNSSVGRARPCQGRGREFESRFPLQIRARSPGSPGLRRFRAVRRARYSVQRCTARGLHIRRSSAMIRGSPSGNSSVGRARPCQGRGREFESRFPLQFSSKTSRCRGFVLSAADDPRGSRLRHLAGWQSGHAADCKSAYAGSIPTSASIVLLATAPARSPPNGGFFVCACFATVALRVHATIRAACAQAFRSPPGWRNWYTQGT